jgi:hypothetical protein
LLVPGERVGVVLPDMSQQLCEKNHFRKIMFE